MSLPHIEEIACAIWEAVPIEDRPLYCGWGSVRGIYYLRTMRQALSVKKLLEKGDLTVPPT